MSDTWADDESSQTILFTGSLDAALHRVVELVRYLVVSKGDQAVARVELGANPVSIGREAGQTIVLADTEVSRRHARVTFVNSEIVVEDLGSTNGTFLNGQRLTAPSTVKDGAVLRLGAHLIKIERRSREEVERAAALERDLLKATNYVLALLPPPLTSGPVLVDWRFVPSAQLGGDAFGYYWLDDQTFVFYLLDVSGHGVGSAMHSVTVLNVLRQRVLPGVNFTNPSEVLGSLNNRFQMDSHHGLFFTVWYGVYDTASRRLRYAAAGHHASYLIDAQRTQSTPLATPALIIGAVPGMEYDVAEVTVPAGATLYVFSDGIFEIVTPEGRWSLTDFEPLLVAPAIPDVPEPERLYRAIKEAAGENGLDDDASVVVLAFP